MPEILDFEDLSSVQALRGPLRASRPVRPDARGSALPAALGAARDPRRAIRRILRIACQIGQSIRVPPSMRLDHYDRIAARWFAVAMDWQGRWFIYHPEYERELERIARIIGLCYAGCAEGRRTRYRTLDQLKSHYAWLERFYQGIVEDMRWMGEICTRCDERLTPSWELPAGERPCACE